MKTIPLTRGKVALVDDEDYEDIAADTWHCNNSGYAVRNRPRSDQKTFGCKEHMHRRIMGLDAKDSREVDHINGNPLDNRRANLRVCTHAENTRNQIPRKGNASGLKGVYWHKETGKWRALIKAGGRSVSLGLFKTKEQAHQAYCEAAKKYFGEFANSGAMS